MARFVLVHGGWHGGWCFRRLAEELADRGHDVAAPDLPCEEIGLTPLDYARAVGR
jgi:pimeloyl-ACP methyl ester carboxylesterase